MTHTNLITALALTLFAGLSTAIGSCIALIAHKTHRSLLAFSLGLSAGVMIYISFAELLTSSQEHLAATYGERLGTTYATLALFAGILVTALVDLMIPEEKNPHEVRCVEDLQKSRKKRNRLQRVGILTALTIAIHNFPEGIATFLTAYENPSLGLAVAMAIAIHNIPEGIAVSIPIYYATQSRTKAFWYSALSGLAEPIGGIVAYLLLLPYLNETLMSLIFASVAGIMIYISIDELLPSAREYGHPHHSITGFITGMAIMAASLIIL